MKTPEEMAEEWCKAHYQQQASMGVKEGTEQAFLAGYKAAKDEYAIKLQEANDTIDGMVDECEGLKTIIYDNEQTNLPTPAKWISVKDRLPEDGQTCIYRIYIPKRNEWKLDYGEWQAEENVFYGEYLDYRDLNWTLTHWMELPAPPEEKE